MYFGDERNESSPFVVLGFPADFTASFRCGSREAPIRVREASKFIEFRSILTNLNMDDVLYDDVGDVPVVYGDIVSSLRNLETMLLGLEESKVPIIIGGEHTLTYSSRVLKYDCLLVFDAHLDLREEYLGYKWSHASWLLRLLETENNLTVGIYGFRVYDDQEILNGKRNGVDFLFTRSHLNKWLSKCKNGIYVSIDMDVLDPSIAPGVSNPEPGGLTLHELLAALRDALSKVPLRGMDVVEVCPPCDKGNVTSILAAKLIVEVTSLHYAFWIKNKKKLW
ncbi:hypothetical protein EYM_07375 [Ignicoccus islandicus DSM 13165]|uniref:Agmatinase n=1 Tax=Ignicoccus islandicus DSM 13165 TaxID=940295 RepID=A0A0U3FSA0_9CREN|nr:hypothetical protein EYM_07375 [Ignicoccus islandicus DSM 13165]